MPTTRPEQGRSGRKKSGFTMVEMLASLLILALMAAGMSGGMSAALNVYQDSVFESDSTSMAATVNTALEDLLRYSERMKLAKDQPGEHFRTFSGLTLPADDEPGAVNFVFTNLEYALVDAYFFTPTNDQGEPSGVIQLKTLGDDTPRDLVNKGAYPNLEISNLNVKYDTDNQVYLISYKIYSTLDAELTKEGKCTVRLLNPLEEEEET